MGNLTVNLLFAAIFAGFAWNSLPRGWRFFRVGWLAMRVNADKAKHDFDVEQDRDLQHGSNFLIAGTAWLLGGIISAGVAIVFVIFAILNVGIFNFIS
ncbi:MAG: hypothetical protein AAFV93_10175 [Chloroflexota bacterium]